MRAIVIALTTLILAFSAAPAMAQFSFDNDEPTTGSADSADYQGKLIILTGQVDVRQGDVRILADVMKIYSRQNAVPGEALSDVDRIEATGNFFYITPDQEVRGNNGVYEQAQDRFIVTGDVILLQGDGNVVTGDRLIYDLGANEAKIVGTCKGRKCGNKGRVNILIKNRGAASGAAG